MRQTSCGRKYIRKISVDQTNEEEKRSQENSPLYTMATIEDALDILPDNGGMGAEKIALTRMCAH